MYYNELLNVFTNTCLTSAMCFFMEENLCKIKDISCYNNSKNRNYKNYIIKVNSDNNNNK